METELSNDFDQNDPDTSVWYLSDGKEQVEQRRYPIRVFELKEHWEWNYREEMHTQRPFLLGKIKVKAIKDKTINEWSLELVEYDDKYSQATISLLHTLCNYGGYREWFECPSCLKRVGILYRDKKHFRCRKCLDLTYRVQSMNYSTLGPTIKNMRKLEKMEKEERRYFYAGKPTKWFRKYKDLNYKVSGAMKFFSEKYSGKK